MANTKYFSSIEKMIESAFNFCRSKHNIKDPLGKMSNPTEFEKDYEMDLKIISNFKFHLARLLVGGSQNNQPYLKREGVDFKEAYLFGSVDRSNAGFGSDIDLLLVVDEKKEEYYSITDRISKRLCSCLKKYHSELEAALDVKFIDDEDIKKRSQFASLLKSSYYPAYKLYPKEPSR